MLNGFSRHIPKSLINKNSCYFNSSFTSMEYLIGMDVLMSSGANVGQIVAERDVVESWNCLRMNLIWNEEMWKMSEKNAAN